MKLYRKMTKMERVVSPADAVSVARIHGWLLRSDDGSELIYAKGNNRLIIRKSDVHSTFSGFSSQCWYPLWITSDGQLLSDDQLEGYELAECPSGNVESHICTDCPPPMLSVIVKDGTTRFTVGPTGMDYEMVHRLVHLRAGNDGEMLVPLDLSKATFNPRKP